MKGRTANRDDRTVVLLRRGQQLRKLCIQLHFLKIGVIFDGYQFTVSQMESPRIHAQRR